MNTLCQSSSVWYPHHIHCSQLLPDRWLQNQPIRITHSILPQPSPPSHSQTMAAAAGAQDPGVTGLRAEWTPESLTPRSQSSLQTDMEMDPLFAGVLNKSNSSSPESIPLRQRRLPASFWQEPDTPRSATLSTSSCPNRCPLPPASSLFYPNPMDALHLHNAYLHAAMAYEPSFYREHSQVWPMHGESWFLSSMDGKCPGIPGQACSAAHGQQDILPRGLWPNLQHKVPNPSPPRSGGHVLWRPVATKISSLHSARFHPFVHWHQTNQPLWTAPVLHLYNSEMTLLFQGSGIYFMTDFIIVCDLSELLCVDHEVKWSLPWNAQVITIITHLPEILSSIALLYCSLFLCLSTLWNSVHSLCFIRKLWVSQSLFTVSSPGYD